jgi:hypothetical protein
MKWNAFAFSQKKNDEVVVFDGPASTQNVSLSSPKLLLLNYVQFAPPVFNMVASSTLILATLITITSTETISFELFEFMFRSGFRGRGWKAASPIRSIRRLLRTREVLLLWMFRPLDSLCFVLCKSCTHVSFSFFLFWNSRLYCCACEVPGVHGRKSFLEPSVLGNLRSEPSPLSSWLKWHRHDNLEWRSFHLQPVRGMPLNPTSPPNLCALFSKFLHVIHNNSPLRWCCNGVHYLGYLQLIPSCISQSY